MIIKSSTKEYSVCINNSFENIGELEYDDNTFVVIDKNLYGLYKESLFGKLNSERLYIVEAIEENKTIETALDICEKMTSIPAKRNAKLVSFGGGIVQDITGFVANILYRGIKWTFYPTTLLAACDSCIGGKTSLNYRKYKNLLGTFYPPDEILIYTPFFKTLTEKDFQSGLGEVVKFNVMFGEQGIQKIEDNIELLLERSDEKLEEFVYNSLLFKKDFIEEDEFDKGLRIHLNFAHTFGHAFETISDYYIPHGTAVAMGTVVANRISLSRGWLTEENVSRVEKILKKIINIDISSVTADMDKILSAIRKDKKQVSTDLTAVLMRDDMKLVIVHDVQNEEIQEAVNYVFNMLKVN